MLSAEPSVSLCENRSLAPPSPDELAVSAEPVPIQVASEAESMGPPAPPALSAAEFAALDPSALPPAVFVPPAPPVDPVSWVVVAVGELSRP